MVIKLKRRLRIVNTTGDPLDTRVEDADTGREVKGVRGFAIEGDITGIRANVDVVAEIDFVVENGTVTHHRLDDKGHYVEVDARD